MLQHSRRFRQLNDRPSDDSLDPCSMLTSGIRCIILSDHAARVPDFLGARERGRKKRNDACPLCPLYVYYDDSGRSVDVR